jgi:hypothetical protein
MLLGRRVTAALAGLLLLQLTLVGSRGACARDSRAGRHEHPTQGMLSKMTDESPKPPFDVLAPRAADFANGRGGRCDTDQQCRSPWVPAHCALMIVCASWVATPPAMQAFAVVRGKVRTRESAGPRAGPTFAPEPPPPRA